MALRCPCGGHFFPRLLTSVSHLGRDIVEREAGDFWVGDRLVRPSLGEIRLGLERVRLEPRSISVLIALAERPREVFSKKELIRTVWGESFVTDEVLTHAIWDLRRAFGDDASNPEFIQTIPKRGYRLIAPVREADPEDLSGVVESMGSAADGSSDRWEPRARAETEEPEGGRSRLPGRWRLWAVVSLALLALTAVWASRADERAAAEERRSIAARNADNSYLQDPDVAVFLTDSADPYAVASFLHAVAQAYRNEEGSERPLWAATRRDPDFVAPWVWLAAPLSRAGSKPDIRQVRDNLERLYDQATTFEKAMIEWAEAVLDGEPALQARALRTALVEAPANRILTHSLAAAHLGLENPEACWNELRPLLRERWKFPGVYTLAAVCAIEKGALEDVRPTLEAALDNEPVDPEVYDLLRALAVYRGDQTETARWAAALDRRKREMFPERYRSPVGGLIELLSQRAVEEEKPEIAGRLRELLD